MDKASEEERGGGDTERGLESGCLGGGRESKRGQRSGLLYVPMVMSRAPLPTAVGRVDIGGGKGEGR
jgi:hypothetical protein